MGNQQTQAEQVQSKFDLDEIVGTQTEGIEKKNILIDNKDGVLVYYFVTEKGVEKMTNQPNTKIKQPYFVTGESFPPITHSLLIQQSQRNIASEGTYEECINGVLIVLIFSDSKLAVLSGDELQLLKTIQLFAPLEAFRLSLIHEMNFSIKEDILHKQKQKELMDQLIQQRQDFQLLLNKQYQQQSNEQQEEGEQKQQQEQQQEREEDKQDRKNSNASQNKERQSGEGKENKEEQKDQGVRSPSTSNGNVDKNINKVDEELIERQNDFMKAQYEIFVQASKLVTNELLDIQSICLSSKSVILVGYKCGLVQKVTVEKNCIELQEECIFFNPLNLKSKIDLEQVIASSEGQDVSWQNFNILMLHSLFCVNATYVIAVHQDAHDNAEQEITKHPSFVYVYEYQNGKKVSYFEATTNKIVKAFVNPNEVTNRTILYILDENNVLNLYNYEKGTFLQSFNVDNSMELIDVNPHFYNKEQMFSQISETYKLLENIPKVQEKTIDGDIFLYFTSDCRTLITQLEYKPIMQNIKPSQNNNGQKQTAKKVLNQRALKVLSSKIACNYKMSVYYPELDTLLLAGQQGQILRFTNFLASIYYFM